MSGASGQDPERALEGPRDLVKYTFYRLQPDWRRLDREQRARGREAVAAILARPPDGVTVRTYSLVGLKADTDLLLWSISAELPPLQELHARVSGSPMGGYLDVSYSYLGMARRSEYLGGHAHGGEGSATTRRPTGRPYLFVYPFVKKREWYALPFEERRRMMGEHFRVGHRYPNVEIHTGYSFGLDDPEFILAFEADEPGVFLDLVYDLRGSEASRYTQLETPIFTCRLLAPARALDLADGLP